MIFGQTHVHRDLKPLLEKIEKGEIDPSSGASEECSVLKDDAVNILIVDDRAENLLALEAILGTLGENLVRACSGEDALERVLENDFACIVLDVQMQGLSGFETAKRIRASERGRHTPILFLTAHTNHNFTVQEAYALGAVDYLVRPLIPIIVRSKVAMFVELLRRTREARAAERKQAGRLLDAVFEALPVGLVVAEPSGRLVRMNRANEELWGNPPPTNSIAEYRRWIGFWTDTGRLIEPHEWALARILSTGESVAGDLVEIERFNGGRRQVIISGAPVRDSESRLVAGVIALLDVTDQKRTAEMLRISEERFRSLFESMDEGYCVIQVEFDADGRPVDYRYLLVNPAFEHHSGIRNAVGKSAREIMPGHETYWFEAYGRVATTGEPVRFVNHVADLGRWMEVSAFRVGAPENRQVAVLFSDVTARRRAEEEVRASEERLNEVFQHAPAFMGVLRGPEHVFERANARYDQLVGGRPLIGRKVKDALPEVVAQGYIELLDKVYRTGEAYSGSDAKVTLDPGDGRQPEERYLDFVYQPLRNADGEVTGIIVQGIDLTDRKRAENLLREKEQRLQLLLGNAADYAVVITDTTGRVLDWMGGAEAVTGFPAAEVVGKSAHIIFTPEDRAANLPEHEMDIAARDGRAEDKRWHLRQDGSQFFAEGVMVPLRGDGGALHGYGKVFRDVTARKRAEEAIRFLANANATLAELVDYESTLERIANLAVGGFADWCVVDVIDVGGGKRRLAVTTAEPDDAVARSAIAAFQPEHEADAVVPHVLRTGEPEVVFDLAEVDPARAPQGAERIQRLLAFGVRSYLCTPLLSRGRVIGGMTFLSSSSRRRFSAEELRVAQSLAERVTIAIENAQLYRALQEQDRRKDEFLATLAHELRNPLAPVRNGIQILRLTGADVETTDRTLEMMGRQLGQMAHLIDDLMDLSRVSSGKVVLRKERITVHTIIEAAVETTRPVIETAAHEFALRLPKDPLTIEADRTRMVQVLANLLNNAAKYTPQGGRIVLSAAENNGDVLIQVADTGIGIPADMLPKVFEMFTQVGTSLDRSQGGLGIGLTLVKRLVEMHGGSVMAESPGPGKGSTFAVRLPLVNQRVETHAAPSTAATQDKQINTFGVLVVDDNRDAAESMALLLRMWGHEVRAAHDGSEALRILATFRPKVILLDLGLPGMTGYEVARSIRESSELRSVILVALTGWGQEEDRRRTREAGFDQHLVKPADPAALERILNEVQNKA